MNADQAASYNEVPYPSLPYKMCHPRPLGVLAAFAGLSPALPQKCRLLEIGCAGGGNILPMAQVFPQSQFMGVDLGSRHIADAQAMAKAAQINNVELLCRDICEFEPDGSFDYIIAHGLYSWVPEGVRNRLLQLIGQHLSPGGVAFVSHMVNPGAYVWQSLRHAMLLTTRDLPMEQKARAGRDTIAAITEISPKLAPRWGPLLLRWAKELDNYSDANFLHDQLGEEYFPVYLTEMVDHAARNSLRYLGDTTIERWPGKPEVKQRVEQAAADPLTRLQLVDIASFRMYRQSIFCRADAPVVAVDATKLIQSAFIASDKGLPPALAVAGSPRPPQPAAQISSQNPLTREVLKSLAGIWPRAASFAQLASQIRQAMATASPDAVARCILELHESDQVELWLNEPTHFGDALDPSKARVSPLARAQAAGGGVVVNLRHEAFTGDDALARRIISQLDGSPPSEEALPHLAVLARHSMLMT